MMLMNLFSVFDPISIFSFSLNWVGMFVILFVLSPFMFYSFQGGIMMLFVNFVKSINSMFCDISSTNYLGIVFISIVLFIYLVMNNLMGLFPFIFTATTHLMVTMGFGVILWLGGALMGWFKNFKVSVAHLVPEGSPLILSFVMVIIESISQLIRPFTLSVRLAANMMAGHLIINLLSMISSLNYFGFMTSFIFQSFLLLLEIGVSLIQGFVFSILLLLYVLEYY